MKKEEIAAIKQFMTIKEASQFLSRGSDIEIGEVDVLRLALNGKLKLSVFLVNKTTARLFSGFSHVEQGEKKIAQKDISSWIEREKNEGKVFFIEGIYDLPMKGGEVLDIEHEVNKFMGVSAQKKIDLHGTFVEDAEGRILQLLEYNGDNQPRPGMPIAAPHFPGIPAPPYAVQKTPKPFGFLDPPGSETHYIPVVNPKTLAGLDLGMRCQTDAYIPAGSLPVGSKFLVRTSSLFDLEKILFPIATDRKSSKKAPETEASKDSARTQEEKQAGSKKDIKPIKCLEGSARRNLEKEAAAPDAPESDTPGGPGEKGQEIVAKRCESSPAEGQDKPSTGRNSREEYLRLPQIIGDRKAGILPRIPVSKSTWWAGVKAGRYPAPVKLSERCTAWKLSDIVELQEKLEATKR